MNKSQSLPAGVQWRLVGSTGPQACSPKVHLCRFFSRKYQIKTSPHIKPHTPLEKQKYIHLKSLGKKPKKNSQLVFIPGLLGLQRGELNIF